MRRSIRTASHALIAVFALAGAAAGVAQTSPAAPPPFVAAHVNAPRVDHHQHLSSATAARLLDQVDGTPATAVPIPADLAALLQAGVERWNDATRLAQLYTSDAVFLEDRLTSGREAVAGVLAGRFSAPFRLIPIAVEQSGSSAVLVTKFVRGPSDDNVIASLTLSLARDPDGAWRIAAEQLRIPGPRRYLPLDAADLVRMLDAAGIARAVVLSTAYLFASPYAPPQSDAASAAAVRAENDWTAAQVARFPDRLVGFCSVNPLKPEAVAEIERCARDLKMTGLKLHFANSGVDLARPADVAAVRAAFATANRLRLPIVVHLGTAKRGYGAADSRIFLDQLLPAAPDVVVQIAHLAGAGPGWYDPALAVFADAVAAKDRRTARLYFDVATVADHQSPEQLALLAKRIRQIGLRRILYGSDGATGGRDTPDVEWGTFRGRVPLTDAEFAVIRDNVAPYLRGSP